MNMENFGATQQMNVSDKTMVSPAGGQATILGTPVKCPICGTENPPTERYCGDCGFLLSSTPVETAPPAELSEQARLAASAGEMEYFLKQGVNSVGRESADVLLTDPAVSRRHAQLTLEDGKCWVEDLGSTNGTFVAGNQVAQGSKVEAADGIELKFGTVALVLKLPTQAETEEDAPVEVEVTTSISTEEAAPEVKETPAVEEPAVEETPQAEETPIARLFSEADPSKDFAIKEGVNTVGRRSSNDIIISDDPYVSGAHAQIVADQLGMWLIDVGSTNGTLLNGTKINPETRMALSGDDEIVFGQTSLKFHAG